MDGVDSRLQVSPDDTTYTIIQGINTFTGTDGRDPIESAAWPDDANHSLPGPRDSSAQASGFYYPDDTNGQKVLRDAIIDKSKPYIQYLRDGSDGYKQQVLVSSFAVDVARDGNANVSISLEGAEAHTEVTGESPTTPALTDAKQGLDCRLYKSGTATSFTGEACSNTSGDTFQIDDDTKRVWSRTGTITVKENGSAATTSYTLDRLNGKIIFDAAPTTPITVDGEYLPMTEVAEAKQYNWELSRQVNEDSAFSDDHNTKGYGPLSFSGSGLMNFDSAADFKSIVENATIVVLEFQTETSVDMRAWVTVSSDEEGSERAGIVEETVSFEGAADSDRNMVKFAA